MQQPVLLLVIQSITTEVFHGAANGVVKKVAKKILKASS
jgi:hypothetical protein